MNNYPIGWDIGWCVVKVESRNWAVLYNGHVVEKELASERDAQNKAWVWEAEMAQEWQAYA